MASMSGWSSLKRWLPRKPNHSPCLSCQTTRASFTPRVGVPAFCAAEVFRCVLTEPSAPPQAVPECPVPRFKPALDKTAGVRPKRGTDGHRRGGGFWKMTCCIAAQTTEDGSPVGERRPLGVSAPMTAPIPPKIYP